MSESKRIKTALVSVYHKEGLDEIITKLHEEGVEFLSTGGTRQFIESLGYPCKAVEDLTTYPSILRYRRNLTDSCRSQELQRCNHRSFSSSIQTIIGYVDGAWRYFFTRRTSLDG